MSTRYEVMAPAEVSVELAIPGTEIGDDRVGQHALILDGGTGAIAVFEGSPAELLAFARLILREVEASL